MPEHARQQGKSASSAPTRAVVTLSPQVATAVRRMADQMDGDPGTAEVVRRGLILLDLYLSLEEDEELVIRNRQSHQLERIRVAWDTF